jgi:hypothetical protein
MKKVREYDTRFIRRTKHWLGVETVPYSGALGNCRDCDVIEWTIFLFQVSWSRIFIVCKPYSLQYFVEGWSILQHDLNNIQEVLHVEHCVNLWCKYRFSSKTLASVPYSGALGNCRDCDVIEWTIFLFQVSWSRIFIVCKLLLFYMGNM